MKIKMCVCVCVNEKREREGGGEKVNLFRNASFSIAKQCYNLNRFIPNIVYSVNEKGERNNHRRNKYAKKK